MKRETSQADDLRSPFAKTLFERRKELGLSQQDVAVAIGIKSPEFIGLMEKGTRKPDLNNVPKLADALQLSRYDLTALFLFTEHLPAYQAIFGKKAPKEPTPVKVSKGGRSHEVSSSDYAIVQQLNALDNATRHSITQLIENNWMVKTTLESGAPTVKVS